MTSGTEKPGVKRHRSRIKRSDKFLRALKGAKRILLLTHNNPDPDGIAGMAGLQLLLGEKLGLPCVLTYGGIVGRAENRTMVELLGMKLVPIPELNLADFDVVVLVDTQPGLGNNSLPADIIPRAVLDHHRTRGRLKGVCFRDVRSSVASVCSIVKEYLDEQGIEPSAKLAAALYYGIKTDLVSRESEISLGGNKQLLELYGRADKKLLTQIESAKLPREHFESFLLALKNTFVYDDVVVCNLDQMTSPDLAGEIADFLQRFEDMNWVLVSGPYRDQLVIALRSAAPEAQAGKFLQELMHGHGSAGGHNTKAGGQIPLVSSNPTSVQQLQNEIKKKLLRRLRRYKERGMRLVPKKRIIGKI